MIGWDPWVKKSVDYLGCKEGKGVMIDIYLCKYHNWMRQLFLFYKISFERKVNIDVNIASKLFCQIYLSFYVYLKYIFLSIYLSILLSNYLPILSIYLYYIFYNFLFTKSILVIIILDSCFYQTYLFIYLFYVLFILSIYLLYVLLKSEWILQSYCK